MSLADEIRTALQHKPDATLQEITGLCRSARDATQISTNIGSFLKRGEVVKTKRAGAPATFALFAGYAPGAKSPPPRAKSAKKKPAKKRAAKKAAAAKSAAKERAPKKAAKRKPRQAPAAGAPAAIAMPPIVEGHVVGRQVDGSVFVFDRESGEYYVVAPAVLPQVAALAA